VPCIPPYDLKGPHCLGAHRSYSCLSSGSKQVINAGSERMTTFLPGVPRLMGVEIMARKAERDERFNLCAFEGESPEKIVEVGDPSLTR